MLGSSLGTLVRDRPKQLLGAGFGTLGAGHFALWTRTSEALGDAVASGNLVDALGALAAYGSAHPAYVLAVLGGLLLVAWRR